MYRHPGDSDSDGGRGRGPPTTTNYRGGGRLDEDDYDGREDMHQFNGTATPQSPAFHPNAAFANFMRSNDPTTSGGAGEGVVVETNGGSRDGGSGRMMHTHSNTGRPMPVDVTTGGGRMIMGARQNSGSNRSPHRRVIAIAAPAPAPTPSLLSVAGPTSGPAVEPAMTPTGLVATGLYTEADSEHSGESGRKMPAVGSARAAHASAPSPANPYSYDNSSSSTPSHSAPTNPSQPPATPAPYQEMMMMAYGAGGAGEDPTIVRAQRQMMASRANSQTERPYPKAGLSEAPTSRAMEPKVPSSPFGRRILTSQAVGRQPDYVSAVVVAHAPGGHLKSRPLPPPSPSPPPPPSPTPPGMCTVECATCGSTLRIPPTAVVVHCPNCDHVHPTASCAVVRMAAAATAAAMGH